MIITTKNKHAFILSCGIQLFGHSSKDFHHSRPTKPVQEENTFNNAPFRRIAIAMFTNSEFTGLYSENPLRSE